MLALTSLAHGWCVMPDRRSGRFLMAVIDGGGTLPPAMGLAAELVRRGHSVEVIADRPMGVGRVDTALSGGRPVRSVMRSRCRGLRAAVDGVPLPPPASTCQRLAVQALGYPPTRQPSVLHPPKSPRPARTHRIRKG